MTSTTEMCGLRKRTVIAILRIRERTADLSWTKSCGRYIASDP